MSITLASAFASKTAPQGGGAMATEGACAGAGASCAAASTRSVAKASPRSARLRGLSPSFCALDDRLLVRLL